MSNLRRILLIEDVERHYTDMLRWLRGEGYDVIHAQTLDEALRLLDAEHVHLVITDINLDEKQKTERHGRYLLEQMHAEMRYSDLPRMIVTSYPDMDEILDMLQTLGVFRYVPRGSSYRDQLLNYARETFAEKVRQNFNLVYDEGCDTLIPEVARDVLPDVQKADYESAAALEVQRLEPQVRDVLERLFLRADHIYIEKLNPGLAGAAVLRVNAHWKDIGWGPQCVVKLGRRSKIEIENGKYEQFVRNAMASNVPANIDVRYSYDLGGVLYRLAEGAAGPLREFDEFYAKRDAHAIAAGVRSVFQDTCRAWYDHPDEPAFMHLPKHYFEVLNLGIDRLSDAARELLPTFDPALPTLRFPTSDAPMLNPIHWLGQHLDDFRLNVRQCTTHGDLTGRNMMIDPDASLGAMSCWLIDFYRTGKSHVLRDFAILETDITYRLLATNHLQDFLALQRDLLENDFQPHIPPVGAGETALAKATHSLRALRGLGMDISKGVAITDAARKAYLVALLITTLNVVRLPNPPIRHEQKCQALAAASMICNRLDQLASRKTIQPDFDDVDTLYGGAAAD